MGAGSGDRLARGAHSAQFEGPKVSQEQWEQMFPDTSGETEIERLRRLRIVGTEDDVAAQEAAKAAEAVMQTEAKKEKSAAPKFIPFRAIHDKIVVFRTELEDEKVGSFYVPDEAKERPQEGKVVAVGPGRYIGDQFVPVSVNVGETVLFGKYSGTEVKVGDKIFLILREEEILLVFEPRADVVETEKAPSANMALCSEGS